MMWGGLNGWPTRTRSGCLQFVCITLGVIPDELDAMIESTRVDSIIASSSSGITPSVMQTNCKHPERVLVGHPFNPPHIIPLVEVVGGAKTAPEPIQRAI